MNKSVKKMALLSVLSVAAVGCQKETVTVEPQIGVEASDTVYTVRVSHKFWGALFFLQKIAVLFGYVGFFSYLCICKSIG